MGDPTWVIYHGHAAADTAVGSGDTVGDIITEWNDKTLCRSERQQTAI